MLSVILIPKIGVMDGIARLTHGTYTEQLNIKLSRELKTRIRRLKYEKDVDTGEEIRKAISQLVERLEKATA